MSTPGHTLEMLIVSTTTSNEDEAGRLAGSIVEQKLAACVQIVPRITSIYYWEGEIRRETECLLLIKTTTDKFTELERFISKNHSYEVPEIVSVRIDDASEEYASWIKGCLSGD